MHRFFVSPSTITNQEFASDDPNLCHQLFKVLKLKKGEKIALCDNTENEYQVELTQVSKANIAGKILEKKFKPDISSISQLHLFVPPLKNPSRWEWMIEKCTEIGVASFTPLITERTEVRTLRKIDRLERIIKEAGELSGRTKLPVIHEPVEFKEFLEARSPVPSEAEGWKLKANLIATLVGTRDLSTLGDALSESASRMGRNDKFPYTLNAKRYTLLLGPVGDFTEQELNLAIQHGFQPISLGSQILRTETAAVVGSTMILIK